MSIGGPKIGKSWLAFSVALAVASGGYALGGVTVGEPRPVLLLALEDGDRRLQDRIRKADTRRPDPFAAALPNPACVPGPGCGDHRGVVGNDAERGAAGDLGHARQGHATSCQW